MKKYVFTFIISVILTMTASAQPDFFTATTCDELCTVTVEMKNGKEVELCGDNGCWATKGDPYMCSFRGVKHFQRCACRLP